MPPLRPFDVCPPRLPLAMAPATHGSHPHPHHLPHAPTQPVAGALALARHRRAAPCPARRRRRRWRARWPTRTRCGATCRWVGGVVGGVHARAQVNVGEEEQRFRGAAKGLRGGRRGVREGARTGGGRLEMVAHTPLASNLHVAPRNRFAAPAHPRSPVDHCRPRL